MTPVFTGYNLFGGSDCFLSLEPRLLPVLDFRRGSPSRHTWTRRQRMGWLLGVVVLGLILGFAQNGWHLMRRLLPPLADSQLEGRRITQREPTVDTRVSPRSLEHEIPGTFISPADPERLLETDSSGRYFPGVMPNYLQTVRDDSPFLQAEQDAWFNLLDVLSTTDLAELKRASRGSTTFVQLFRQSDEYRGELVTLHGIVRRVYRVTAPKNDRGIKDYYQVWLTPDDNPNNVEVVFSLRLPPGFPVGEGLAEHAEITGFHFKRWLYRAQDSLRSAPVILAQTVEWQKRPVLGNRSNERFGGVLMILASTVLTAVVFAAFLFFRTRRVRRASPTEVRIEVPDSIGPNE